MKNINNIINKLHKNIGKPQIFLFISMFVMVFIGYFYIQHTWVSTTNQTSNNAMILSKSVAASIDVETLKSLSATENDLDTDAYESIKQRMINLAKENKHVRFTYIYTQKNGKIYFMADSEPIHSEDYSPPGQEFTEATEQDKKPFQDGQALITKPAKDRWGNWVSVFVPIKDENDRVVAVLGMDYPAHIWPDKAIASTTQSGIIIYVLFMFLFAFYMILNKNLLLKNEKSILESVQADSAKSSLLIKQSQTNFDNFFNTVNDMLFVLDMEGTILYVNDTAYKKLGYSKDELIGTSVMNIPPPDKKDELAKIFKNMLVDKTTYFTIPVMTKNGKEIPAETQVVIGAWNGVESIFGITKDISVLKKSLDKFSRAFHSNSALMSISTVEEGICIDVNSTFLKTLGFERDEVIGKKTTELDIFGESNQRDMLKEQFKKLGKLENIDMLFKDRNGLEHNGIFSADSIDIDSTPCWLTTVVDITRQKEVERLLLSKQEMLKTVAEATNELLTDTNLYRAISNSLKIIGKTTKVDRAYFFKNDYDNDKQTFTTSQKSEWNSSFANPTIDNPELQNVTFDEIGDFIAPLSNKKPFIAIIEKLEPSKTRDLLEMQGILSIIVLPIFVDDYFWGFIGFYECKYKRLWEEDEIAILISFTNSIATAIQRSDFETKIEYLSYHSGLTGLYNRRKFEMEFEKIKQSNIYPVSIIMGDVNGLKLTNDAFGHTQGDKILTKISKIMKEECGEDACVARHGGDEFTAILPNSSYDEANEIVSRINKRCIEATTNDLMLSISFGIATKATKNDDLDHCFHLAEDRMYASKLLNAKSTKSAIIANLRTVMEEKTGETRKHCERIAELSKKVGEVLNMQDFEIKNLELLSLLHDIGKTGIPDNILLKPDKLTDKEWEIMKKHCEIGFRIANAMPELVPIAEAILSHHEKWDGTGYPRNLKNEQIPLMSRIVSVIDSYDAMTNDRPYRKALTKEQAKNELLKCSGTQFDPKIVDLFISNFLDN